MVYLKYTTGHFETGTKSRYLQPVESVQSLFCALKKKRPYTVMFIVVYVLHTCICLLPIVYFVNSVHVC